MLKVEFSHFLSNPLFFIESSRILANISKIVSVRPFPERSPEFEFCKAHGLKLFELETKVSRILSDLKFVESKNFLLAKDGRFIRKLQSIESKILDGKMDFEKGRRRLIKLEGKLFGYPECCTRTYAKSKGSFPLETSLIVDTFEKGFFEELMNKLRKSEIFFLPQFFTLNFYPCKADCRRAEKIGLKIEKSLGDFSLAFRIRTMLNTLYLLCVAYKSINYGGLLGRTAKKFFSKLEGEELEMIEAVSRVDYEDFSNNFIRNLMVRYHDRDYQYV